MKYRLGLLGCGISYTLSPLIHGEIFRRFGVDASYEILDVEAGQLEETAGRLKEFNGFNVTKPYKKSIIKYLDGDESGCGAVNAVVCSDGRAVGYNTDGYGFMRSFREGCPLGGGAKVLVLGAGGAAEVCVRQLLSGGFKVYVKNRSPEKGRALCAATGALEYDGQPVDAVVNCTSCGLSEGEDAAAGLDLDGVKYCYDLIYSPPETLFLKRAHSAGAAVKNGLDMLIYQAVRADELIIGIRAGEADFAAVKAAVQSKLNA